MFASLAFVFLFGLMGAAVFEKMKLPRIIGMLLVGILIGPYALGLLDPTILSISGDLRKLALMLILLRAGLSLDLGDLKRVGRPAVLMAFVPATFEVLAVVLFAPMILGVTRVEAAVMGAVLLIALALVIRSVGVCLCVARTKLTKRERLFCVIAYLPKATVQAAIGATPLAMGLPCGNLVLSVAVLAVVLFAPMILGVTRVEAAVMGAVLLIALALVIRSVGVCLCVARTKLTKRERLFCVIAYLPKATVQAAIGATPLAMGLPCGNLVLSVAVLAILLTAPLGAIGMDATADRLLQK